MRQWFAFQLQWFRLQGHWLRNQLIPLREWSRSRREFLDNYYWMLADRSLFVRLCWRYAFWVSFFARGIVRVHGRGLWLKCCESCALNADLLFGGDRQERFLKRYKQEIRQMQERNREIDQQWRREMEAAFDLRARNAARTNPGFVQPPQNIQ